MCCRSWRGWREIFGPTQAQGIALEKAKTEKEAHGECESECPGYCGAQDTFYIGNMKGVGRIYQQTFVDTYLKVTFAKLYDCKTPITAADLLNDRVVPFFDEKEVKLSRLCHVGEFYLSIEPVCRRPSVTKSTAYAGAYRPKTTSKSAILSQCDNATARGCRPTAERLDAI